MNVYVVTSTNHMGIDGSYTHVIGCYTSKEGAENKVKKLTVEYEQVGQHSYDFWCFNIEEVPLKGLLKIGLGGV